MKSFREVNDELVEGHTAASWRAGFGACLNNFGRCYILIIAYVPISLADN